MRIESQAADAIRGIASVTDVEEDKMFPFGPDPNWYERHWLSPVPVKLPLRIPAVLMSLAALVLAVWLR